MVRILQRVRLLPLPNPTYICNCIFISLSIVTGILELIPAITFLFIMHPQMNHVDRSYTKTPEIPHHHSSQSGFGVNISRVDSNLRATEFDGILNSSSSIGQIRRDTPLVLQHKGYTGYGAVTTGAGSNEKSTKI